MERHSGPYIPKHTDDPKLTIRFSSEPKRDIKRELRKRARKRRWQKHCA